MGFMCARINRGGVRLRGAKPGSINVVFSSEPLEVSRVPMWLVLTSALVSLQQFVLSKPARQQNTPGLHCRTLNEYCLGTKYRKEIY